MPKMTRAETEHWADEGMAAVELRRAVRYITQLLNEHEWAEHLSTDPDASALEQAITPLIGRAYPHPAPAAPSDGKAVLPRELMESYLAVAQESTFKGFSESVIKDQITRLHETVYRMGFECGWRVREEIAARAVPGEPT